MFASRQLGRGGDKVISPPPVALVEGRRRGSGVSQAPPIACALERLKSFIRSIRLSLNRRFGGILSTGFTRAISICGKVAVVALFAPIVVDSCACAASDHAKATPPNRLMNSRRFIRSPRRRGRAISPAKQDQSLVALKLISNLVGACTGAVIVGSFRACLRRSFGRPTGAPW